MFRIRKIHDDTTAANRDAITQVQDILRRQFQGIPEADIARLAEQLHNPVRFRFRTILFVAEGARHQVRGFALLLHAADVGFCYLEYISVAPGAGDRGIGGALYERVREEAADLGAHGLFFESLPDDPALSRDPEIRRQNAARLRFYERYGARPIANTAYETPLTPGDDNPPYLVFDALGRSEPLRRDAARTIVRAILERKYGRLCPQEYVDRVVDSFRDDPVVLRPPRAVKPAAGERLVPVRERRIALVVNDRHSIHHIRERGYVQAPVRISSILKELERTDLFERLPARHFADDHIKAVHDGGYVEYLKRACAQVPAGKSVYPYIFPIRNHARPPQDIPLRAGYYCIDTFTPLNQNAWPAAVGAVDCALTAAHCLLDGWRLAYALVRPPGHHAERKSFGGFCYFNSAAVAAHFLSRYGRVAVLDVDYHHGNGTQDIFYQRDDVLTISTHGHPRYTYPYFSGFDDEKGAGPGTGYNLNLPLPENIDGAQYREALERALKRVRRHRPRFLVLSLGLDTAKGDPTGSWTLAAKDFTENGRLIGALDMPILVVQEGGYRTRSLGVNARHFFSGLWEAVAKTNGQAMPPAAAREARAGGR
ncbi:MAG: histone deacetylase family protein [Pseudomonadota bacterium]|nr:histone deacetylase family protein [Pseudomonadota bacterium]